MKTRSLEIRNIDKIMRRANSAYPRVSPYRAHMTTTGKQISERHRNWIQRAGEAVDSRRSMVFGYDLERIIANDLEGLRRNKLGDCGESSTLMMAALTANGIKDFELAHLHFDAEIYNNETKKLLATHSYNTTHEFLVKNLDPKADTKNPKSYGKDLVVIDAWAGFCTNLQEAFNKYFDMFMFGIRETENKRDNVTIKYSPRFTFLTGLTDSSKLNSDNFEKRYPELVVKK